MTHKPYRLLTLSRIELVEIVVGSFVSAVLIYAALPEPGRLASGHRAGDPSDWSQQAVSSKAAIPIAEDR